MEDDILLSDSIALKGGTAINLTIFDLPRLSVDIVMDCIECPMGILLKERGQINDHIRKYMAASGYTLSPKSKQYYALDSFLYEYVNAGGVKDNLKIEINYMLRCHVFPVSYKPAILPCDDIELTVLSVEPMEIFDFMLTEEEMKEIRALDKGKCMQDPDAPGIGEFLLSPFDVHAND